jgi:Transcriptional regulatory protein, C terminal
MALIEARGEVVGKDALMTRVWPDRVVEENNLQAHISALRRAFGADWDLIRTIAGRGYQFTGEIRVPSASPDERVDARLAAAQRAAGLPPANLPVPVSELIGRDDEVAEVVNLIGAHRLVTLGEFGAVNRVMLQSEAWAIHGPWLRERPGRLWPTPPTTTPQAGAFMGAGDYVHAARRRLEMIAAVEEARSRAFR